MNIFHSNIINQLVLTQTTKITNLNEAIISKRESITSLLNAENPVVSHLAQNSFLREKTVIFMNG
jgi:hypothetical protein